MTLCVPSDDRLFSPPDAGNLHVRWDEGGGQLPASTLLVIPLPPSSLRLRVSARGPSSFLRGLAPSRENLFSFSFLQSTHTVHSFVILLS